MNLKKYQKKFHLFFNNNVGVYLITCYVSDTDDF
jgi:hypothetical protein